MLAQWCQRKTGDKDVSRNDRHNRKDAQQHTIYPDLPKTVEEFGDVYNPPTDGPSGGGGK